MPDIHFQLLILSIVRWLIPILQIGGVLAALMYRRLSKRQFFVSIGFGGIVFASIYSWFAAPLLTTLADDDATIQAIINVGAIVMTLSWAALVVGLFAVFRDVTQRLQLHEDREQARAAALGTR
jgi:hypothetical protein